MSHEAEQQSQARGVTIIGCSIGVAASHVGMHPQTLRDYERHGLIQPYRTPGGSRRYREEELVRLRRIQQLTTSGISLAGVRMILQLEDQLNKAHQRIAQLEAQLPQPATQYTPGNQLITRSMSVEIVHVPRPRRSPRWRNT